MTIRSGNVAARNRAMALVFLAAGAGATPAHAEVSLGRLFLTPQERSALERLRADPASADPPPARKENLAATSSVGRAAPVSVTGYVARSDGRSSAWLNGKMVHDHASGDDGLQAAGADLPGVALRRVDGSILRLLVGQTYDPISDTTLEGFERKRETVSPRVQEPADGGVDQDTGGRQ